MKLIEFLIYPAVWIAISTSARLMSNTVQGSSFNSTGSWIADIWFFAVYSWLPVIPIIFFIGIVHASLLFFLHRKSKVKRKNFSINLSLVIGLISMVASFFYFKYAISSWSEIFINYSLPVFLTCFTSGFLLNSKRFREP